MSEATPVSAAPKAEMTEGEALALLSRQLRVVLGNFMKFAFQECAAKRPEQLEKAARCMADGGRLTIYSSTVGEHDFQVTLAVLRDGEVVEVSGLAVRGTGAITH
jgi:hypothetical protein